MLGKKNENLWESLRGIMVNGALGRSLGYSMYSLGRLFSSATKTMGDSNFPKRPALGQLNFIE
jgi:hypothetical protein